MEKIGLEASVQFGDVSVTVENTVKKLYEAEFTANVSTRGDNLVFTSPSIGPEIWGNKVLYVKIRDKAGPREGYFYGSDIICVNSMAAMGYEYGSDAGTESVAAQYFWLKPGQDHIIQGFRAPTNTFPYGITKVFVYAVDGHFELYGSVWTDTSQDPGIVDGTFKVELFGIDLPNGEPVFDIDYELI